MMREKNAALFKAAFLLYFLIVKKAWTPASAGATDFLSSYRR
jgi:hypothetical protein